jgi:hypothetical protein
MTAAITVDEALPVLETRLRQASFSPDEPDVQSAVNVFREFSAQPVDVADDVHLFECGVFQDHDGEERFLWSLKRQFTHGEEGDEGPMEHLQLNFYFPVRAGDDDRNLVVWSSDHASVERFWEHLESLPEFRDAFERGAPDAMEIYQEEV